MELLGYDPEMENFDQSPYHDNEQGSQGGKTLAIKASGLVPLIEGHHHTRQRWTGNFTTFSDKQRILDGELPYVELMFMGTPGDKKEMRLKAYAQSKGYGSWLTVACSERGSYRAADVLDFLEKHLPQWRQGRLWRLMFADDYGPHKCEAVKRLCWMRGYVMVPHGGGSTPVTQTPDTHLNQHVRRKYTAKESVELIRLMREQGGVPRVGEETSIDFMAEIFSDVDLHLRAAGGYLATGAKAALDNSSLDAFIVKEAGDIWNREHMREIIQKEVQWVRFEARQGRLLWTFEHVYSLVKKYPKHDCDEILERVEHLQHFDEDEYADTAPMASKEARLAAAVAAAPEGGEDSGSEGPGGEDDDGADGKDDGPEELLLGEEGVATGDDHEKEGAALASAAVAADASAAFA